MAEQKKQVRTLHDRLKIIEEVEKNPGVKRVDIAKWLGLSSSHVSVDRLVAMSGVETV
jgi:Mn-dependent DtxR family transcriptional regulator